MGLSGPISLRVLLFHAGMGWSGFYCKISLRLARFEIMKKKNGASKVVAYATHAVLSGGAIDNINNSQLDELVVANSIPLSDEAKKCKKIRTLQLAKLLGESVRRISNEESISAMFG